MGQLQDTDVFLYDSLYSHTEISLTTNILLAKLLNSSKHFIRLCVPQMPKQWEASDCGLFSIAYATHLAFGKDPSGVTFIQPSMRNHFLHCIEDEKIKPFPVGPERRKRGASKQIIINIDMYCYCRCPDDGTRNPL